EWADRTWAATANFSPSYIGGSPGVVAAAQRSSARYFTRPDATHLHHDPAATSMMGHAASFTVGKQAGGLTGEVGVDAVSPGYEVNDLGFQTSADRIIVETGFGYEETRPGRIFRNWQVNLGPDFTFNYGGNLVERDVGVFSRFEFMNFWEG